jgi:hypothetical protein
MHLTQLRGLLCVALVATCIAAVPSEAAGKRRSVRKTPVQGQFTADVSGTILDNVTGQPVVSARVHAGRVSKTTDAAGKFELKGVEAAGSLIIEVSRSGYTTKTQTLSTGGVHNLTIRVDPLPTVTVRKIDGTVLNLDYDSVRFGYPIPFSGYRDAEFEDFCKADGTAIVIDRSELRRMNGPATTVKHAPCCGDVDTLKVNVTLKTGESMDVYFVDACNGFPNIDVFGIDHVTAKAQYIAFTQLAEIVFP